MVVKVKDNMPLVCLAYDFHGSTNTLQAPGLEISTHEMYTKFQKMTGCVLHLFENDQKKKYYVALIIADSKQARKFEETWDRSDGDVFISWIPLPLVVSIAVASSDRLLHHHNLILNESRDILLAFFRNGLIIQCLQLITNTDYPALKMFSSPTWERNRLAVATPTVRTTPQPMDKVFLVVKFRDGILMGCRRVYDGDNFTTFELTLELLDLAALDIDEDFPRWFPGHDYVQIAPHLFVMICSAPCPNYYYIFKSKLLIPTHLVSLLVGQYDHVLINHESQAALRAIEGHPLMPRDFTPSNPLGALIDENDVTEAIPEFKTAVDRDRKHGEWVRYMRDGFFILLGMHFKKRYGLNSDILRIICRKVILLGKPT